MAELSAAAAVVEQRLASLEARVTKLEAPAPPPPPTPPTPPPVSGLPALNLAAAGLDRASDYSRGDGYTEGSFQYSGQRKPGDPYGPMGNQKTLQQACPVDTVVKRGTVRSLRIVLQAGDTPFGHNESCEWEPQAGPRYASKWGFWNVNKLGQRNTYGLSFRVAPDFVAPQGWGLIAQFYSVNFQTFLGSPPIGLNIVNDDLEMSINTGVVPLGKPGPWEVNTYQKIVPGPLPRGRWIDVILAVDWFHDARGRIDTHYRLEGSYWVQSGAPYTGPTLRTNPAYTLGEVDPKVDSTWVKLGLYRRSGCKTDTNGVLVYPPSCPAPQQPDTHLWHGAFARSPLGGDSGVAALKAFFGG